MMVTRCRIEMVMKDNEASLMRESATWNSRCGWCDFLKQLKHKGLFAKKTKSRVVQIDLV